MGSKTWNIKIKGNVSITAPADINNPATYILLEQEDWCEPEIEFVRGFIQPGMTCLDMDTGYGVYALTMARGVEVEAKGKGKVVALNADKLFDESLQVNNLQDLVLENQGNLTFDFIRLGNTLPDMDIIKKGTPLVMFPPKDETVQLFRKHGLGIYRHIPAINALAPVEQNEPIEGSLFACSKKHEQILLDKGVLVAANQKRLEVQAQTWQQCLARFPYVGSLYSSWKAASLDPGYEQALNACLTAMYSDLPLSARFILHKQSLTTFTALNQQGDSHITTVMVLIRLLIDHGLRKKAAAIAANLLQDIGQGKQFKVDRPFLSPMRSFDNRPAKADLGKWITAAIMETLEKYRSPTSYHRAADHLPLLQQIFNLPDHSLEMERRLALCAMRTGKNITIQGDSRLLSGDHLNQGVWRDIAGLNSPHSTSTTEITERFIPPPYPADLPQQKNSVNWDRSVSSRLAFNISCQDCDTVTELSLEPGRTDEPVNSQCPSCGKNLTFGYGQAVQLAKDEYLRLLRHTEKLAADKHPETNVFIVRLISYALILEYFTPVRFICLFATRIGHLAANTEIMLKQHKHVFKMTNAIYIYFPTQPICNSFLLEMWSRVLYFSPLAQNLYSFCKKTPMFKHLSIFTFDVNDQMASDGKDRHGLIARTKPTLHFTRADHERAKPHLEKMGIPPGAPYVCFLGRDSAYMKQHQPNHDWSYHDYRNMPIHDYLPAMHALADMGIYCLRMGHIVEERLDGGRPEIIDYASDFRDEFMDVYLSGTCEMFVSCGTGIDSVPIIFKKSVCFVNQLPIGNTPWGWKCICIHRKILRTNDNKYLTYKDQLETDIAWFQRNEIYSQAGYKIVNNNSEEIKEAALETWQRAQGQWKECQKGEQLHEKAMSLFKEYDKYNNRKFKARLGINFLKSNPWLLW